jgi:hypothetical protein
MADSMIEENIISAVLRMETSTPAAVQTDLNTSRLRLKQKTNTALLPHGAKDIKKFKVGVSANKKKQ